MQLFDRGVMSAAFAMFGACALAVVALLALSAWPIQVRVQTQSSSRAVIQPVVEKPSFRLTASDFTHQPMTERVLTLGASGRVEARQYGHLYDRNTDLTVAMVMPPNGQPLQENLQAEMARLRFLQLFTPVNSWSMQRYYDLDTRYGMVRAADMQVNVDGLIKLCLAFVSRFDVADAYLAGWACLANGEHPDAYELACTIDHIVFDAKLAAPAADAFFHTRQAGASTCTAAPVAQTSDTRVAVPRARR